MKRNLLIYVIAVILCALQVEAQVNPNSRNNFENNGRDMYGNQIDPSTRAQRLDSANVEVKSLPPKLYMWKIKDMLGNRDIIVADTLFFQYQNKDLTEGVNGEYNHIGNLASPRLSRIFFNRQDDATTMFTAPLSATFKTYNAFKFTNSNIPYTNLKYYKAGSNPNHNEWFNMYFSVNANKRLAFGFNFDYMYGRGLYRNQSTNYFNASVFGSYIGEKYEAQGIYSNNFFKMNENGGIKDDRYITSPEEMAEGRRIVEHNNIPVYLGSTSNRNHALYVFFTHKYNLGFTKKIAETPNDTIKKKKVFVPVTSFIHTLKIDRATHRFRSNDKIENYYENIYTKPKETAINDTTKHIGIENLVGISLREGFNKYAKAGITVFATHKLNSYWLMSREGDNWNDKMNEHEVFVGGEISKRQGKSLHYSAIGKFGVLGQAIGEFDVNGNVGLNFKLLKDTISLTARGNVSLANAPFYMRHYHSKHFWWDNDMEKEFRTKIEGELNIKRLGTNIRVGAQNIKNYTYLGEKGTPQQKNDNLQIVHASLKQDLRLGILHFDNEITMQKTSNSDVLPLPLLSVYSNLYLKFKLAKKVLSVQLGADMRYFSEYNAPVYLPALQQFHVQGGEKRTKVGGYPMVNAYANFHLKQVRFFVMMTHVNEGLGRNKGFFVPHYPINPRVLQVGLSWNFYD